MTDDIARIGVKLTLDAGNYIDTMSAATAETNAFQAAAKRAASGAGQLKAGGGVTSASGPSAAQSLGGVNVSLSVSKGQIAELRTQIQRGLGTIPVTLAPQLSKTGPYSPQAIIGTVFSAMGGFSPTQGRTMARQAIEQFIPKVPTRAHGGPVQQGRPTIVGERRAEVFVPPSHGRIEPNVERYYHEQARLRRREAELAAVEYQREQQHRREMGRIRGGGVRGYGGKYGSSKPAPSRSYADYQDRMWGDPSTDRGYFYHQTDSLVDIRKGGWRGAGVQPMGQSWWSGPGTRLARAHMSVPSMRLVRTPESAFPRDPSHFLVGEDMVERPVFLPPTGIETTSKAIPRRRLQYWGEDNDWHRFRRGRARMSGGPAEPMGPLQRRIAGLPPLETPPPVVVEQKPVFEPEWMRRARESKLPPKVYRRLGGPAEAPETVDWRQQPNWREAPRTEHVRVSTLVPIRGEDREHHPRGAHDYAYLDELTEKIRREGFDEERPVTVHYDPFYHAAYVADGNHRLAVARRLGMETIPTTIQIQQKKWPKFRGSRLPGISAVAPDETGYIPASLPPSWIGLKRRGGKIKHAGAGSRAYRSLMAMGPGGGGTYPVDPTVPVPSTGHALGISAYLPGASSIHVDPSDPRGFLRAFHTQRKAGAPYVGTWWDPNSNLIDVDPSTVVQDKVGANELLYATGPIRKGGEQAAYDLGADQTWYRKRSRAKVLKDAGGLQDIIAGRRARQGGGPVFELEGVHRNIAPRAQATVERLLAQYPMVGEHLTRVTMTRGIQPYAAYESAPAREAGSSPTAGLWNAQAAIPGTIHLSPASAGKFSAMEYYTPSGKMRKDKGFHVLGTSSIEGNVTHEVGHALRRHIEQSYMRYLPPSLQGGSLMGASLQGQGLEGLKLPETAQQLFDLEQILRADPRVLREREPGFENFYGISPYAEQARVMPSFMGGGPFEPFAELFSSLHTPGANPSKIPVPLLDRMSKMLVSLKMGRQHGGGVHGKRLPLTWTAYGHEISRSALRPFLRNYEAMTDYALSNHGGISRFAGNIWYPGRRRHLLDDALAAGALPTAGLEIGRKGAPRKNFAPFLHAARAVIPAAAAASPGLYDAKAVAWAQYMSRAATDPAFLAEIMGQSDPAVIESVLRGVKRGSIPRELAAMASMSEPRMGTKLSAGRYGWEGISKGWDIARGADWRTILANSDKVLPFTRNTYGNERLRTIDSHDFDIAGGGTKLGMRLEESKYGNLAPTRAFPGGRPSAARAHVLEAARLSQEYHEDVWPTTRRHQAGLWVPHFPITGQPIENSLTGLVVPKGFRSALPPGFKLGPGGLLVPHRAGGGPALASDPAHGLVHPGGGLVSQIFQTGADWARDPFMAMMAYQAQQQRKGKRGGGPVHASDGVFAGTYKDARLLHSFTPPRFKPAYPVQQTLSGQMLSAIDQIRGVPEREHALTFSPTGGLMGHAVGEELSVAPHHITGRPWWKSPNDTHYGFENEYEMVNGYMTKVPKAALRLSGLTNVHQHPDMGREGREIWRPSGGDITTMLAGDMREAWVVTPHHTTIMRQGKLPNNFLGFPEHPSDAMRGIFRDKNYLGQVANTNEELFEALNSRRTNLDARFWTESMDELAEKYKFEWEHYIHPRRHAGTQMRLPFREEGGPVWKKLLTQGVIGTRNMGRRAERYYQQRYKGFDEHGLMGMGGPGRGAFDRLVQAAGYEGDTKWNEFGADTDYDFKRRSGFNISFASRANLAEKLKALDPRPRLSETETLNNLWGKETVGGSASQVQHAVRFDQLLEDPIIPPAFRGGAPQPMLKALGILHRAIRTAYSHDVEPRVSGTWKDIELGLKFLPKTNAYPINTRPWGLPLHGSTGGPKDLDLPPGQYTRGYPSRLVDVHGDVTGGTYPGQNAGLDKLGVKDFNDPTQFTDAGYRTIHKLLEGRHNAGGGRHREMDGLYIVGEIGPELFVPNRLQHLIPKKVMDQIPRAAGGMQVIGRKRNELFTPPEDGVIVPNRLMDQIPHARWGVRDATGRFVSRDSLPTIQTRQDDIGNLSLSGGPRSPLDVPTFLRNQQAAAQTVTAQTVNVNASGTTTVSARNAAAAGALGAAAVNRMSPGTTALHGVAVPPGTNPETIARIRSLSTATSTAGTPNDPKAVATLLGLKTVEEATSERAAEVSKLEKTAAAGARGIQIRRPNYAEDLREGRAGIGKELPSRTARGAVASISSYLFGGVQGYDRAMVARAQAEKAYTQAHNRTGYAIQKGVANLNAYRSEVDKYGEGTPERADAEKELEGARKKNSETIKPLVQAERQYQKELDAATKKTMPTTGGVLRNLGVIIGSTSLYGMAMQAASKIIDEAALPAMQRVGDVMMGMAPTATKVTNALADQTRQQGGNYQAAIAGTAATAGLSLSVGSWVEDALKASVVAKAGGKAWSEASDQILAAASMQGGAQGLYGGYGGVMGGPLFGTQFGGGSGAVEELVNTIRASRGDTGIGRYIGAAGAGAAAGAGLGAWSATPFGVGAGAVGGAAAGGIGAIVGDILNQTPGGEPALRPKNVQEMYYSPTEFGNWNEVSQKFNSMMDAELAITDSTNAAMTRAQKRVGAAAGPTMAYRGQEARDAGKSPAAAALPQMVKNLMNTGYAFTDATGKIITDFNTIDKALKDWTTGLTIPDAAEWGKTMERKVAVQFERLDIASMITQTLTIPLNQAMQRIQSPYLPAGSGVVPGAAGISYWQKQRTRAGASFGNQQGWSDWAKGMATDEYQQILSGKPTVKFGKGGTPTFGGGMGLSKGAAAEAAGYMARATELQVAQEIDNQKAIDKAYAEIQSQPGPGTMQTVSLGEGQFGKQMLPTSGQANADRYKGLMTSAQDASREVANLQSQIGELSATASQASWANTTRLALRGIADAAGMLGQAGGSALGKLQRHLWQIGRASQALDLALQQRQITTQLAIAQFQAPGETGEERYMRQKEAIITAGIGQQKLGYAKESYAGTGEEWKIQAQRNLQDAQAAWAASQAAHTAEVETAAAQAAIAALNTQIATDLGKADDIYNTAMNKYSIAQDLAAQYADTFGGTIKQANADLSTLGDYVGGASTGMRSFLEALGFSFQKTRTGTSVTAPTIAHAAGIVGMAKGKTRAIMGEAGDEAVAILRNPRSVDVGGGFGGGPSSVTVNINGPVVRGEQDISHLARAVAHEVERVLAKKGQMLGLRSPAV